MQLKTAQLTRRIGVSVTVALVAAFALAGCNSNSNATSTSNRDAAQKTGQTVSSKPATKTCPLTGATRRKGQDISRPPLAVKIDNVSEALPQQGINNADVVVEELVEGGLTRLMAIYQCNSAPTVGPIRSLRISDADILALLHGSVLGFSGDNPKDLPPIIAHSDAVLISQDNDPQYFYRSDVHPAPHNVFSSTTKILRAGIAKRKSLKAPKPLFSYGALDPSAKTAHHVSMSWPAASASWTWSKNQWLRTQDGSADHLASGAQISSTNVVILSVTIASTGLHDVLGTPSPDDVTVSGHSRTAWVLRNGKMIKGTWRRPTIGSPITLRDKAGHTLNLAPGRTWIELLPTPRAPSKG